MTTAPLRDDRPSSVTDSLPGQPDPTVIIDAATPEQLRSWAACWVQHWSHEAVAYRAEQAERQFAARIKAASVDVSLARAWSDGTQAPIGYLALRNRRFPWLDDPTWTNPMLAHRGGHYMGGPVDWKTGLPVRQGDSGVVAA